MVEIKAWIVLTIGLAAWVGYRVLRHLTAGRTSLAREFLVSLLFIYGLGVVSVTFFPMNIVLYAFDARSVNLVPLVGLLRMIRYADQPMVMENLVGNLVLLAPLGIFLPLLFKPARRIGTMLGLGFLVSLGIELFQLALKVRIFDVDDLLSNTLGVLLGFGIYLLLTRIAYPAPLLEAFSRPQRPGQKRAFMAYTGLVLAAFLGVYSAQIIQQTQTRAAILAELTQDQGQVLGAPQFGEFMLVLTENPLGSPAYRIYRQIFFDRYTLVQWEDDLQMPQDQFTVTGMSTGSAMDYFIIARSRLPLAEMVSGEDRFPVATVGEYHFSYARLPMQEERYFSFHFVDGAGTELELTQEQ